MKWEVGQTVFAVPIHPGARDAGDPFEATITKVGRLYLSTERSSVDPAGRASRYAGPTFRVRDGWEKSQFSAKYQLFPDRAAYEAHAEKREACRKIRRHLDFMAGTMEKLSLDEARAVLAILDAAAARGAPS